MNGQLFLSMLETQIRHVHVILVLCTLGLLEFSRMETVAEWKLAVLGCCMLAYGYLLHKYWQLRKRLTHAMSQ